MSNIVKHDRTKFSFVEKKILCEAWQKTNLSKNAFRRKHNLPKSFHYWCKQLLEVKNVSSSEAPTKISTEKSTWIPIVTKNETSQSLSVAKHFDIVKIKLNCNDVKFKITLPLVQAITFIKEMRNATTIVR